MKYRRVYLTLSIALGLLCLLYFMFPTYRAVKIPTEFLESGEIFLGQSLNELRQNRNIKIGQYDITENQTNTYFNGIGYYFDKFFLKSDRLKSIILVDDISENSMPVENMVIVLFEFCKQKYGQNFKIFEVENEGKPYLPRITWQFDGYAVVLSYMPFEKYLALKKHQKFIPLNISLQIMYDSENTYKESTEFTLHSLHLQ